MIRDDPKMLVTAASQEPKAADLILKPTREMQKAGAAYEPEHAVVDLQHRCPASGDRSIRPNHIAWLNAPPVTSR